MKAFTLLTLIIHQAGAAFNLESTAVGHCNSRERDKINELLADDPFFSGMTEVQLLGAGGYGMAVEMVKGDRLNGTYYAVKVGDDPEIVDNRGVVDDARLDIPNSDLNITVRGTRVSDYLRSKNVPFISHTITYRHLLFKNPGDEYDHLAGLGVFDFDMYANDAPASTKVVLAIELGDLGDLEKYAKQLRLDHDLSQGDKMDIFLDLFYKIMIAVKGMNDQNIIHGDLKEINIFLRTFAGFGKNVAPIIGDWDLAYKTNSPGETWRRPLYTPMYRPPEMEFFVDNTREHSLLKTTPIDYTYTGSEDIYATAVTMMSFADTMGLVIEAEDEVGRLLKDMAYPLSFKQLKGVSTGHFGKRITNLRKYTKQYGKTIKNNPEREQLIELSEKICGAIKKWPVKDAEEVLFIKSSEGSLLDKIFSSKDHGFYFYLLNKFMKKFKVTAQNVQQYFGALIQAQHITVEEAVGFFQIRDFLAERTAFPDIMANRASHEFILQKLYEFINGASRDIRALKSGMERDMATLNGLIVQEHANQETDDEKSFVYVDPDFFELTLAEIEPIISKFDRFDLVKGVYGDDFDIPSQEVLYMSCYRFGGKMEDQISVSKTFDEANMDRTFLEIEPFMKERKLKKEELSKTVKKESVKTII